MSEFIAVCPKCRQQILCDTTYMGKRIACPVCLQEIAIPEPPQQTGPAAQPQPAASRSNTAGKQNSMFLAIAVGVAVLAVAAGIVAIFALHKSPAETAPAPAPVAAAPTPVPSPAPAQNPPPTETAAPAPAPAAGPAQAQDPCRAIWTFDQDNGSTATDSSGNGNDATLVGDKATWTSSARVGSGALNLGGSSYAETHGAVVNTARSFTVAAWVNIAAIDKQHNQTVVSIDGNEISGFYLMLYRSGPKFAFNRSEGDDRQAARTLALASFNAVPKTWYHLAGVYDADARTISLYVNGNLEQAVPFSGSWQAMGKTAIGRGLYGHANVDFVNGTVDDVRLYSSALTATQIQALVFK